MTVAISGKIAPVARLEWAVPESAWTSQGSLVSHSRGGSWSLHLG